MEKKQESEQKVTNVDVDWAYGVLSVMKEAMDKAAGDLDACNELMRELVDELPNILEAFIILVSGEHQQFVAGVVGSWVNMMKSVRKK